VSGIIISGTVDLDPAQVDAALAAGRTLIEGALTQDGCLDYEWCLDPRHPGRIRVFERWRDEASLAAHFRNRWYRDMRATIGRFDIRGSNVAKYRFDLSEPVYDSRGEPRADFFTRPVLPNTSS